MNGRAQKLKRVVVSVAVVGAAIAALAFLARAQTPSPGTCAPVSPLVVESVQFKDQQCRVGTIGPTVGTCTVYVLQGVPVLDCAGVALQKFTVAAWP